MKRLNPTLIALLKAMQTNRFGTSKKHANSAAKQALERPAPKNGDLYDHEVHLISKGIDEVQNPAYFSAELKFAVVIGLIGLLLILIPLLFFGFTGATLLIACFGLIILTHSFDEIFLKDVPATLNDQVHQTAVAQLAESGEASRKLIGLLGKILIMIICGIEGYLNADSVVAIIGESSLSPSMVKTISFGVTVLIAYALYKTMHAAAYEKRCNEARRVIRHLEANDTVKADAMKRHLGGALNHQFSPAHETKSKQIAFWFLFVFVLILSFALRVGFVLSTPKEQEPNADTEKMYFNEKIATKI